jgi:hypothetical protein
MPHTKTRVPPQRIIRSLDAPLPEGGTLHERVRDPKVPLSDDDSDEDLDMLAGVVEASISLSLSSKLIPPHLSQVLSGSITSSRTRELLRLIYESGGDRVLRYVFGLEDGRRFARKSWSRLSQRVDFGLMALHDKMRALCSIDHKLLFAPTFSSPQQLAMKSFFFGFFSGLD